MTITMNAGMMIMRCAEFAWRARSRVRVCVYYRLFARTSPDTQYTRGTHTTKHTHSHIGPCSYGALVLCLCPFEVRRSVGGPGRGRTQVTRKQRPHGGMRSHPEARYGEMYVIEFSFSEAVRCDSARTHNYSAETASFLCGGLTVSTRWGFRSPVCVAV